MTGKINVYNKFTYWQICQFNLICISHQHRYHIHATHVLYKLNHDIIMICWDNYNIIWSQIKYNILHYTWSWWSLCTLTCMQYTLSSRHPTTISDPTATGEENTSPGSRKWPSRLPSLRSSRYTDPRTLEQHTTTKADIFTTKGVL